MDTSGPNQAKRILEGLLLRIAKQEEAAMSTLYDLTSGRVFGIAKRILQSQEWAEEATLDAYTKIWCQAHRFNDSLGSAKVWIQTLTRNAALDLLRKQIRRTKMEEVETFLADEEAIAPRQEDDLIVTEKSDHLKKALKKLPQNQRCLLLAAFFDGLSHREIATAFLLPLGTVKTRIRSGLEFLRTELDKQGRVSN